MSDTIHYVYGIVPSTIGLESVPTGLDEASVVLETEAGVGALVSELDAASYGESVDDRLTDLSWLGPRAVAHDRVVTWASDRGPVVPLPMFSMFRERARVREMLRARAAEVIPV